MAGLIIRPILEIVLLGLAYWTGYVFLKAVTLGSIRLAPLTTIFAKSKNKKQQKRKQADESMWIHHPMPERFLKAEYTVFVGVLVWVIVGCGIYLGTRGTESTVPQAHHPIDFRATATGAFTLTSFRQK